VGEGGIAYPGERTASIALLCVAFVLVAATLSTGPGGIRSEAGGGPPISHDLGAMATDEKLASWNPNVSCTADRVTMAEVLGPAYPDQSQQGGKYQKSSGGGVPNQRSLSPPCTITNKTGQVLSTLVQIEGVYVAQYGIQTYDCRTTYDGVNGGQPYPDNRSICDNLGYIFEVGTWGAFMQMEIDRDWLAKGYCGPGLSPCDNATLAQYMSYGRISLDVQGFVYWDGENWELHPFTGWRLSPLAVFPVADQMTRNSTEAATVSVHGSSDDSVTLTVSGCPPDTQCTLSPAVGTRSFTSTLRIDTGSGSPLGTSDLTIAATSESGSATVPFRLTITHLLTRTFEHGDGGTFSQTEDTYISQGSPTGRFGTGPKLQVDGVGCAPVGTKCQKALIKFPLIIGPNSAQIPAGSRIVDARLWLTTTNKGSPQDLFQVTEAWTETTATWNRFATPGSPGTRARESIISPKVLGKFPLNLTSIVQRWVDGEANQGILLNSSGSDATNYQSRESPDKPSLMVVFEDSNAPPPFDFSVSVNPSSGSVDPGGSVRATVTASLASGSSNEVQYSCADLPPGSTCAFTPPTCQPTCTAGLVLATSSDTPGGTFRVSIRATDRTTARGTVFTLTVTSPPPPPFDFSIAVNPASGSVAPGGATSATVGATLVSGATQSVQFSCANLPTGTTCSFTPPSCSPTCSAALSLATSADTPPGRYSVSIVASDGSIARQVSYSLDVGSVGTLSFRKGDGGAFSETDDAFIYNGTPNGNRGSDAVLFVDAADCIMRLTVCRSLLMFPNFIGTNAGQVPAGSTIVSATLELNVTNTGKGQLIYQVTEGWTESGVTWNSFAIPGAPGTKGSGIAFVTRIGVIVINITSIVQNWVSGDSNIGLLIRSDSTDGADYRSSESTTPPKLTVTFRPRADGQPGSTSNALSAAPPESWSPSDLLVPLLGVATAGLGLLDARRRVRKGRGQRG
jgi:hypothetical protein